MKRSQLFISYSHRDRSWFMRVSEQLGVLEREGLVTTFNDMQIDVGMDWFARLDREMAEAKIAMLLISASYLTSAFIRNEEVPRLMDRHGGEGLQLYPLLVRDCAWQEVQWLARLQMRPLGVRAISTMRSGALDSCLADVAREVASIVRAGKRQPRGRLPRAISEPDRLRPPPSPALAASPRHQPPGRVLKDDGVRELVIFRTSLQRTYLKVSENGIECYLDDERPEKSGHQWTLSRTEISRILDENDISIKQKYSNGRGLVTIGPQRDWIYSKKLFPEPAMLERALQRLLTAAL